MYSDSICIFLIPICRRLTSCTLNSVLLFVLSSWQRLMSIEKLCCRPRKKIIRVLFSRTAAMRFRKNHSRSAAVKVVFLLLALPIGSQETRLFYDVDLAERCLCVERERERVYFAWVDSGGISPPGSQRKKRWVSKWRRCSLKPSLATGSGDVERVTAEKQDRTGPDRTVEVQTLKFRRRGVKHLPCKSGSTDQLMVLWRAGFVFKQRFVPRGHLDHNWNFKFWM